MTNQELPAKLAEQLGTVKDRQQKVDIILEYADELRFMNAVQTIELCQLAIDLSTAVESGQSTYFKGLILGLLLKGYCHQLMGDYQIFIEISEEALSYAESSNEIDLIPQCYLRIGQGYLRISQYVEAYRYLYQASLLFHEMESKKEQVAIKSSLAVLLSEIGNYEQALDENLGALKLAEQADLIESAYVIRNNIADNFLKLGKYDAVLDYTSQVIEYIQKNKFDVLKSFSGSLASLACLEKGELEKAKYYVDLFFDHLVHTNDKKGLILAYYAYSKIAQKRNQFEKAIENSLIAITLAREINARDDEYENLELLAGLYEGLGDYKTALNYFQEAQTIKQSIFNRNSTHRMQILEIIHQTDKAKQEAEIFRFKNLELESKVNEKTHSLSERTQELKESLERETQLADKLKRVLVETEQLSHLKTQIIETISHGFRTPLTVMNTSSELLRFHSDRLSSEKQQKHLRHIQDSVRYLSEILNETIFIGQISQNPIVPHYKRFLESAFCENLVEEIYDAIPSNSRIEIICCTSEKPEDSKSTVFVDLSLIRRATINLITNAIKYSEDSSSIQVIVDSSGQSLMIEVIDVGIGIPLEAQDSIFNLFYRAENARIHRGIGFGLHITKRICEAIGAEIAVFSEGENKGSAFKMTIPKMPQSKMQDS